MARWDILHVNTLKVEHGLPEPEVRRGLAEGRISRDDCARKTGDERWWHIYEISELRPGSSDEVQITEEPPVLEEGSLRDLLAEAEPPQQASRPRRKRPAAPAAPGGRMESKPSVPAPEVAPAPAAVPLDDGLAPSQPLVFMKRRQNSEEELDMAPAATVAFLLILFFVIVSGVAMQKAIEFPKPSSEDPQAKQPIPLEDLQKENILVRVKADNSILVNDEPTASGELVSKLTGLRRDTLSTDLVIRAEDAAYHETVVTVVDAATLAGITNIKMAAPTKAQKAAPVKKRRVKT
jgi:biopolymer transport protein ExbD